MEKNKSDIGWKLWMQWVLANTISVALATTLTIKFSRMGSGAIGHAIMGTFGILLFGFIVGITQWFILFRFGIPAWWIPATGIGVFVFFILFSPVSLLGAAILQFPILWHRVRWSGLWILAHIPAYFLMEREYQTLYFAISSSIESPIFETRYIALMVIRFINIVITGFVLIWLLRHPKTNSIA